MMAKKKCYRCGEDSQSKEHVPARCYFPEEEQYRKNLITVPSCKKHNEDTSKDDEYVRNIISMSLGNNAVAFEQFLEKTFESLKDSVGLFKSTVKNAQRVYTKEEGGELKPSYAFQIDRARFDDAMKKISYALFYSVHKEPWNKELIIMTEYLRNSDMSTDAYGKLIQSLNKLIQEHPFDGQNPQVFKFKFLKSESEDIHEQVLRMKFYEGFDIWITTVTRIANS